MDRAEAKVFYEQIALQGTVGDWKVGKFINNGKSAIVLEGERDGVVAALKVFHKSIVDRYGKDTQRARILRELELVEKGHPNLIRILDGGECGKSGLLFLVMEKLDSPNLEDCLLDVPSSKVGEIISQVAAAAEYLETLNLAHRDIKPSNIAVQLDQTKATLLDLGVVRPIGDKGVTDEDKATFLGTLQYAPPEFHDGRVEDTVEGWRAVTFYQLGTVLHDLIMKRPIYADYCDPYPRLPKAVESVVPQIESDDIPESIIYLARCCLVKDWKDRLRLVKWEYFREGMPMAIAEGHEADSVRILANLKRAEKAVPKRTSAQSVRDQTAEVREEFRDAIGNAFEKQVPLRTTPVKKDGRGTCGFQVMIAPSDYLGTSKDLVIEVALKTDGAASELVELSGKVTYGGGHTVLGEEEGLFYGPFQLERIVTALKKLVAQAIADLLKG